MDKIIKLHDKTFRLCIEGKEIDRMIRHVAREINREMADTRPLFLPVLNGAFMFAADLLKEISVEGTEVTFIRVNSYVGTASTGEVKEILGLDDNIAGRDLVIIEDIVDTGRSIAYLLQELQARTPRRVKIAALFYKPAALVHDLTIDYAGIPLDNDFVVGRGLDYNGLGRNLPDLYTLVHD